MAITAALLLGESEWDILCPIGDYASAEAARRALDSARAWFTMIEGEACIQVSVDGEEDRLLATQDVMIHELSSEARSRLGPPIDVTAAGAIETITAALEGRDPSYIITVEDMIPSGKTLGDFLARYGVGYRPDHLANSLVPVSTVSAE